MEIYESFRRTNFLLIYAMVILHSLHMLKYIEVSSWISCIFYSIATIFVGSSRSLLFYNVKQEGETNTKISNGDNSLMTLKNALSIPVLATVSLLSAYFAIINKWSIFN